jgi:hypothetical protein
MNSIAVPKRRIRSSLVVPVTNYNTQQYGLNIYQKVCLVRNCKISISVQLCFVAYICFSFRWSKSKDNKRRYTEESSTYEEEVDLDRESCKRITNTGTTFKMKRSQVRCLKLDLNRIPILVLLEQYYPTRQTSSFYNIGSILVSCYNKLLSY